jgi:hypothetical protein
LSLGGTRVDDAGLVQLKRMTQLGMLDLSGTSVSDAGLSNLKGMTRLQWLYISSTQTSAAGDQELKQAMPKLDIQRSHFDSIFGDLASPGPRTGRSKRR